jgi:deoxyribose-phosphate aldolase
MRHHLPVKAAGGVRTYEEAVAMIQLGVKQLELRVQRI